jgi:hypothetical protein
MKGDDPGERRGAPLLSRARSPLAIDAGLALHVYLSAADEVAGR